MALASTTMNTKEYQADAEAAVEEDFKLHYRTTDTNLFLEKLLPVNEKDVESILKSMEEKGTYKTRSKTWSGFPGRNNRENKYKEAILYTPFQTVAEAIRIAADTLAKKSDMGPASWVDYHSKSPKSFDGTGAKLRADVVLALDMVAKRGGGVKSQKTTSAEIWWMQIVAAVEMKRSDTPSTWIDVVKQLVMYLRRTLREQLDRRFIFGLTLGPEMMTVWVHDRSGVLGTKTAFNIHKEPKKFIQVIAALSLLSPAKLGFDPTMKLLVSPNVAEFPYQPTEEFVNSYDHAPHNRQWVITMNSGTQYVTVRTVSAIRAELMRGRGTLVWVVVRFGEKKGKSNEEILVLKQSWSPRSVTDEHTLYEAASGSDCDQIGKIDLSEEVKISGQSDTTNMLIRSGLDDSTGLGKRSTTQRPAPESSDRYLQIEDTAWDEIQEINDRSTGPPVSRVRVRVVMSTYGWLIKHFSTPRELVHVLRDAIKGHKHLYTHGVLHRDISTGNILVEWRRGCEETPSTSGRLIDLDHAKLGTPSSGLNIIQPEDEDVNVICMVLKKSGPIQPDVARQALGFFPSDHDRTSAIVYVEAALCRALQLGRLAPGQICTSEHLQWKPVKLRYDFAFKSAEFLQKGSRTGTLPFTSGEILGNRVYVAKSLGRNKKLFHDAVHDLESFWWVVVYLCLTRKGQGGGRREELSEKNQDDKQYFPLRRVVNCLFASDDEHTITKNKVDLFTSSDDLDKFVLVHFLPDFQQLQPLVKEWFSLLRLAYEFRAFEYHHIHDMVLKILEKTLELMVIDHIDTAVKDVLDTRKTGIKQLEGDAFGRTQDSPPPQLSPSNQRILSSPLSSPPSSPTPAPKKHRGTTLVRKDRG